jgi:2-oxoglutarate ferredoxin oxidoreductase subunit delta
MASDPEAVKKTAVIAEDEDSSFIHVFPEWCKGCGICVAFCPRQVLEMKGQKAFVAHPERCVRCFLCARRCPDFAIGIADGKGRVDEKTGKAVKAPGASPAAGEGD